MSKEKKEAHRKTQRDKERNFGKISFCFIPMKTKIFLSIKPASKRVSAKPDSTEWKRL